MKDERGERSKNSPTIDLGIAGRRVPVHSHVAYLWSNERDFEKAVGFVEVGLRGADHCVVVGDEKETAAVLAVLENRGVDVETLVVEKRLVLARPFASGREMLARISTIFEEAFTAGAPFVRLFGNVGWGRETWPADAELVVFESHLNEIAERFDSVLLCLHQLPAMTGLVLRHGILGTHPTVLEGAEVLANPLFLPLEEVPERLPSIAFDVSKQQELQKQVRRSTEILQAIFDNIPVMISFRDSAGELLLVNREWERVLGWTLEEAQRIDVLTELFPDPESRREVVEGLQRADRRWTDFRALARDGRMVDTSGASVALSDGTRLGFGQDITDQKHAEEALRESEQRFRAIFESTLDAVVIFDDELRYVGVNPAACALFGRAQEDFIGRRVGEASAPGRDVEEAWRASRHLGEGQGEWTIVRPDGTLRNVEYTARVGFLPGRNLAVLRDVTERKRLEDKLKRSEAYLSEGEKLSHTGSWAWNVLTGELFWSAETFQIWGLDPASATPSLKEGLGSIHPADRDTVDRELSSALNERRMFDVQFRLLGPEKSTRHVQSLGKPILSGAGEVLEYVGVVMDRTDRRDAEEKLRQSTEELRALSERLRVVREEERTQMAREVHDEVGQALTALRMDVAWLEGKVTAAGDQRANLESKLRSMSELIDTTLDAVQRIATELRPGVLDELGLEAAIEWYVREFEKRTGIACRFLSELGGPPIDPGRSTAVFRILQEALTNVARHSVATRTTINIASDRERLRLEIRDNGRGIPEDRIDSSASLGLVGMRERARALGGDVEIRGAAGRGTTVTLTIPL